MTLRDLCLSQNLGVVVLEFDHRCTELNPRVRDLPTTPRSAPERGPSLHTCNTCSMSEEPQNRDLGLER